MFHSIEKGSASLGTRLLPGAWIVSLYQRFTDALKTEDSCQEMPLGGLTQARTQVQRAIPVPKWECFVFSEKRASGQAPYPKCGELEARTSAFLKKLAVATRVSRALPRSRAGMAGLTAYRGFPIIAASRLSSRAREHSTLKRNEKKQALYYGRRKVRPYSFPAQIDLVGCRPSIPVE